MNGYPSIFSTTKTQYCDRCDEFAFAEPQKWEVIAGKTLCDDCAEAVRFSFPTSQAVDGRSN